MKTRLIPFVIVGAVASAAAQEAARWPGSVEQQFKQLDRDGDEKLSRAEYPQPEIFDAVDANKDGFATLEEVQAYFRNRRGLGGTATTPPAQAEGQLDAMVKSLDTNGDGEITKEEAGNAPWFDRVDQNRDGVIDAAELETLRKARGARGSGATRTRAAPPTPGQAPTSC